MKNDKAVIQKSADLELVLLSGKIFRLEGKTFEEILLEKPVAEALARMDETLTPLLEKTWYFHGQTYENNSTYFKIFTEELRYVHKNRWLPADIAISPKFWISLEKPSHFEEKEIVDTIVRVMLANLDLRILLRDFR